MPKRGKTADKPVRDKGLPSITKKLNTLDWGTLILKHADTVALDDTDELEL